ncbi:MAG: hypothetical protein LBT65_04525 [Synergistaceae bacterium]|jgi:hypothetical protein|nr:hypothetical protein [Synergistaceae bacterium]
MKIMLSRSIFVNTPFRILSFSLSGFAAISRAPRLRLSMTGERGPVE